jgi:ribonuclease HI
MLYSGGMARVTVFTDGAAKGNPGPGGYGAVIVHDGMIREIGGAKAHTTNNEMELMAVLEALKAITMDGLSIAIYTDSRYVAEGAEKWIHGWQRNGWKTKAGAAVKNSEVWKALVPHIARHHITWHVVPGHVGILGNERADVIASTFGHGKKPTLFVGPEHAYEFDIHNTAYDVHAKAERSRVRARRSEKAYSYVSMVDGVIETHATWPACEARVRGKSGVRFKKALSKEDEIAIMREFRGS